jgi:hypothetical protein
MKHKHLKVNLREEDVKGMIDTYHFLAFNNEGEEKIICQRILKQLKKSIKQ